MFKFNRGCERSLKKILLFFIDFYYKYIRETVIY